MTPDLSPSTLAPSATRAHAMKNCIATIAAIAQLLERDVASRGRPRLHRLREATLRLGLLVAEDLRPDATGDASCCVGDVFDDVQAGSVDDARRRGVDLRFGGAVTGMVAIPRDDFAEVLVNLVRNALEATVQEDRIAVVAIALADRRFQIRVSDTGTGMSAEELASYGRPYRTSKVGGCGLGVAASRAILARYGGALDVESRPAGRGTCVTLTIPRA